MRVAGGKRDLIERRLKELQKESRLVRADIQALNRALKRPDVLEAAPRLKSRPAEAPRVPAPSRPDPAVSNQEAGPGDQAKVLGELFAWRPPTGPRLRTTGDILQQTPSPGPSSEAATRSRAVLKDHRFVNYFASGSFVGKQPLKQERRVQRNKAIFMLIIVVIFGFILFKLLF